MSASNGDSLAESMRLGGGEKDGPQGGGGGGGGSGGGGGGPGSKDKEKQRPRSKSTLSKLVGSKVAKSLTALPPSTGDLDIGPVPSGPPPSVTGASSAAGLGAGLMSIFNQGAPQTSEQLEDGVPKTVHQLCKYLLETAPKTEGLFRVTPNQGDVKKCLAVFEEGGFPDFEQIAKAAHVAAGVLKSYFRGLPEPLLTYELYDMFIAASGVPDHDTRLIKIKQVISYLPSQNYALLVYLVHFLREICRHSDVNKMNSENLGIVFAPNLLRPKNVLKDEATDAPYASSLVQSMIDELDRIFEGCKVPKLFADSAHAKKEQPAPAKEPKDKKAKPKASADNQNAFFDDVRHARLDNITKVLQAGKVDLNAPDTRGWTALMMAVHRSDVAMMELLLKAGCDVNLQNVRKENALHRAIMIGSVPAVRFLLENAARHDIVNDEDGRGPLHVASYAGEAEAGALLLKHGAVVDLRDLSRKTPLLLAAYAGHQNVCALLLDHGASISKYDEFGWTPLMMASFAGHAEVVNLLLDRGASISATNRKGKTAAMLATEASQEDIVKLLGTARVKRRSSRRHSTGKHLDVPPGGDVLSISTAMTLPKMKERQEPSPVAAGAAAEASAS